MSSDENEFNDAQSEDGESSAMTHDETATLTLQFKQLSDEARDLKSRLKRRTNIIEELRRAYLKDVVALKHIVGEVISETENEAVVNQYLHHIPSVDLRGFYRTILDVAVFTNISPKPSLY